MSCPGLVVVAALGLRARSDGSFASRSADKPHVGLGERRSAAIQISTDDPEGRAVRQGSRPSFISCDTKAHHR